MISRDRRRREYLCDMVYGELADAEVWTVGEPKIRGGRVVAQIGRIRLRAAQPTARGQRAPNGRLGAAEGGPRFRRLPRISSYRRPYYCSNRRTRQAPLFFAGPPAAASHPPPFAKPHGPNVGLPTQRRTKFQPIRNQRYRYQARTLVFPNSNHAHPPKKTGEIPLWHGGHLAARRPEL